MKIRRNTTRTTKDLVDTGVIAYKNSYADTRGKHFVIAVDAVEPGKNGFTRYIAEFSPQELEELVLSQSASQMLDAIGVTAAKDFAAMLKRVLNLPV